MDRQYHILVVEDEERWREDILREALEDGGYQAETSSSYSEAVTALDQRAFDLVVIDVNLTGVPGNQDGLRVLERMAALGHESLVVLISGSKTLAMAEESTKKFKPIAFVDKTTFDVAEFVTLVTEAFKKMSKTRKISDSSECCSGSG
jgi:DNA-binding NtrC family response regulator